MFHRKQQVATPQGPNETSRPAEEKQGREGGPPMSSTGERKKKMTCVEFQEVLPYIFESGGEPSEMEDPKNCPICSDLVQEPRHIPDQSKPRLPPPPPHPPGLDKNHNS